MEKFIRLFFAATIAFAITPAQAGQVLVIEATGNFLDSSGGGWHPQPDLPPDMRAAKAFTHTLMLDMDSCTINTQAGLAGSCTRIREIAKGGFYDFDSGWIDPVTGPVNFSISNTGFNATNAYRYINQPMPEGYPYPEVWGTLMFSDLIGDWAQPANDFAQLLNQPLPVQQIQPVHAPNASLGLSSHENNSIQPFIMETGFEFATIYYVPEPDTLAIFGLGLLAVVFLRRRTNFV